MGFETAPTGDRWGGSREKARAQASCLPCPSELGFLPFLVAVVILLVSLFLGTLTCFCVRRRKREKSGKWGS